MCLFPIKAEPQKEGRPQFTHEGSIELPCGKCSECISLRAVEWATRARHEISLHNENSFITLTYNDENLPSHHIVKAPFQKFIKRLRKHTKSNIRYMVSHEYGTQFFRPHHHVIIFGWNPREQYDSRSTGSGEKIFRSKELEKLWTEGFSSVGTANERSAYYIASYALKGKKHEIVLPNGDMEIVSDQFDCSRRPAIGRNYVDLYHRQLVASGEPLPRYYAKVMETNYPDSFEEYQNSKLLTLKPRSASEKHAKFVLDEYKKTSLNNEFRSTPESNQEDYWKKEYLKKSRDDYHHHIQGKQK